MTHVRSRVIVTYTTREDAVHARDAYHSATGVRPTLIGGPHPTDSRYDRPWSLAILWQSGDPEP